MLLREYLKQFTKEELLLRAKIFGLKGYSGLNKAVLINHIVTSLCEKGLIRGRLACLTKEQIAFFRKACNIPQNLSLERADDILQLYKGMLGFVDDATSRFCVFEEVAEAYKNFDDEKFKTEQFKKGWMVKCLRFFRQFYGIAPLEVIYKLYKLKVKDSMDEMMDILYEMPLDVIEANIYDMEELGFIDWPTHDPLYSYEGLILDFSLSEDEDLDDLLKEQMAKEFYIPSAQQIEEIYKIGYEQSVMAYKRLEKFFVKNLHMTYEMAYAFCLAVWAKNYEGISPVKLIDKMAEHNIVFDNDNQLKEFVELIMDAHNNTRLIENRGHTPIEMIKKYR